MELQIEQDLGFQERDWFVQRVAWVLMCLLVVASVVGLLGPGPLSHQQARSADGSVEADYLRWTRRGREANLSLRVDPAAVRDGQVAVALPSRYFDDMQLQGVVPQPAEVRVQGEDTVFVFAAPSADGPLPIRFFLQADGMGPLDAHVRVNGATARFGQFLWP